MTNNSILIAIERLWQQTINLINSKLGAEELPVYWQSHIEEKIEQIKMLQDEGGKDCFSFIAMADTHYPSNLGKKSPILVKHILDKCDIRYALLLGDAQTRGCHSTKELLLAENVQIEEMLSPIRDRLLQTEGNHDGAYGWLDRDGNGKYDNTDKEPDERETYVYNLTPAELHSAIYRKVGLVGDVHFDESGSGYYIDDVANKVRYIILNTQCNKYELQEDGTSKYPKMWLMNFTQPQFDLVIDALNNVPSDSWGVIIAGHCPLFQEIGDRTVMQGVLNAYANKTTYVGEYAGVAEADALYTNQIPISKDMDGNIVGLQKGYRYNSSDVLVAAEGVDATGFIPIKTGDVVRFKNIQFRNETINGVTAGAYYLRIYDSNYTILNGQSGATIADYWHYLGSNYTTDADGNIASIKIADQLTNAAYMRIAFVPVEGAEAIITVNEEIVSGGNNKNLAEPLPNNTTDTTKWVNGYRFGSAGITAQNSGVPSTLSNEIPITFGDVIRIKGVTLREGSDRWALMLRSSEGETYTEWQYFDKNLTSGVVTYLAYEGVENGVYTYRITSDTIGNTPLSFRIAFPTPTNANDVVITINELENSGGGTPYDAVSVNCDFTKAEGQLIGYFHGHTHVDSDNTTNGVKNIGIRCDAKEENTEELRNERVEGTITEQSFDVFTVNKKTNTIYATKIGAGEDRVISYPMSTIGVGGSGNKVDAIDGNMEEY